MATKSKFNHFKKDSPVISVEAARKLLGKKYRQLSDEEISEIITDLEILSNIVLDCSDRINYNNK